MPTIDQADSAIGSTVVFLEAVRAYAAHAGTRGLILGEATPAAVHLAVQVRDALAMLIGEILEQHFDPCERSDAS